MSDPVFHATRETPGLLTMQMGGRFDAIAMEAALDRLVPEMDGMSHGGILMRDLGVEWPTLGALAVELRHWGQLMAMIAKVDRVAILTDNAWLGTAARIESVLIPGITDRVFASTEEAAARAWLAEGQTATA